MASLILNEINLEGMDLNTQTYVAVYSSLNIQTQVKKKNCKQGPECTNAQNWNYRNKSSVHVYRPIIKRNTTPTEITIKNFQVYKTNITGTKLFFKAHL